MLQSTSVSVWLPALRSGSGSDVFTLRLAEGLAKAGHRPIVHWFDRRFELAPWLLRAVPAPVGVDVVHAGSWQGFAFKRAGIPLIVTEHHCSLHPLLGTYHSPMQRLYHRFCVQRWNRESYKDAASVIAVSRFCAAVLNSHVPGRLEVIHNGVDLQRFSPAPTHRAGSVFRLLFVGNPSRRKGFDVLERLANELGSGFEVLCLGGLRESARDLHSAMGSRVRFLPRIDPYKMPELYRSVEAVLVPTRFETFGYVALEAMACGVPVVGFDSCGTAEICVNEITALLSPVDDLGSLVRNIRRLAADNEFRYMLGNSGRERAVSYFSQEQCVEAYVDQYRLALQSRGSDVQ